MNIVRFPIFLLFLLATANEAWAYIDPGTGSFVIQMVIAGIVGALFYFRRFFASLISKFHRGKRNEEKDD